MTATIETDILRSWHFSDSVFPFPIGAFETSCHTVPETLSFLDFLATYCLGSPLLLKLYFIHGLLLSLSFPNYDRYIINSVYPSALVNYWLHFLSLRISYTLKSHLPQISVWSFICTRINLESPKHGAHPTMALSFFSSPTF